MRPFCANGARVLAAGPNVHLDARLALALHLAFHELATNAQKYGALSSRFGAVRIGWHIRQVSPGLLASWRSSGASMADRR
jgi:two-component sensor histidine kinase